MTIKTVLSPNYNYNFNTETGFFMRWGETKDKDCDFSPIRPEILDIQISSICHGGCNFCYQSNVPNGKNMNFFTFKNIIDKMPMLTQIAIATGDINANPDIWNMMEYARGKNIIPNITISGYRLTNDIVLNLVKYTGAIAVSHYSDDVCFDAVQKLTNMGAKQVNIHQLLSNETIEDCFSVLKKYKTDKRLENLNAIVFLSLKQKGRGTVYSRVKDKDYKRLVEYGLTNNVPIGFDSCGCARFLDVIKKRVDYSKIEKFCEFCEATLFSSFVNVDGLYFPCSFMDGRTQGINIIENNDFLQDVWYNKETIRWRSELLKNKRNCFIYNI